MADALPGQASVTDTPGTLRALFAYFLLGWVRAGLVGATVVGAAFIGPSFEGRSTESVPRSFRSSAIIDGHGTAS